MLVNHRNTDNTKLTDKKIQNTNTFCKIFLSFINFAAAPEVSCPACILC